MEQFQTIYNGNNIFIVTSVVDNEGDNSNIEEQGNNNDEIYYCTYYKRDSVLKWRCSERQCRNSQNSFTEAKCRHIEFQMSHYAEPLFQSFIEVIGEVKAIVDLSVSFQFIPPPLRLMDNRNNVVYELAQDNTTDERKLQIMSPFALEKSSQCR